MKEEYTMDREKIEKELHEHVVNHSPCIFGKSVIKSKNYDLKIYDSLNNTKSIMKLYDDLLAFKNIQKEKYGNEFSSFIAIFLDKNITNEKDFDNKLWNILNILNQKDKQYHKWDKSVSSSPLDSNFSFSFGERAYFVLGMHKGSSRLSRKFKYPTLVFNARYYFDLLRENGTMEKYRTMIREKDSNTQGTINPNLISYSDNDSEAKLYSGMEISADWVCPFNP
jgi:FPC/CPF motif-containing protein YcgG